MLSKSCRAIACLVLFVSTFFGAAHSQTPEKAISVTFLDRNGNEIGKRGVPGEPVTADSVNYFLDWAYEEAQRLVKEKGINDTTFTAKTTFDPILQKMADAALNSTLATEAEKRHITEVSLISMEAGGAVRVMIGGRNYGANPLNHVTHAFRQPGSSFGTYAFLMALEKGATPDMMVDDSAPQCGNWSPSSYVAYQGRLTLASGLAKSLNTIAVQLSLDKKYGGRDNFLNVLDKLGVSETLNSSHCTAAERILAPFRCTTPRTVHIKKTCSMALGDQGITPLAHTAGHAHLANGGKSMKPYAIVELRNKEGAILYDHKRDAPPTKQLFDPKAVAMLNGMLEKVVSEGTGKAAMLDFTTAAGKTGTSSAYKDAWFIGFAGQLVTGVWMGNDDYSGMDKVTGGQYPAVAWASFYKSTANIVELPPKK